MKTSIGIQRLSIAVLAFAITGAVALGLRAGSERSTRAAAPPAASELASLPSVATDTDIERMQVVAPGPAPDRAARPANPPAPAVDWAALSSGIVEAPLEGDAAVVAMHADLKTGLSDAQSLAIVRAADAGAHAPGRSGVGVAVVGRGSPRGGGGGRCD